MRAIYLYNTLFHNLVHERVNRTFDLIKDSKIVVIYNHLFKTLMMMMLMMMMRMKWTMLMKLHFQYQEIEQESREEI